MGKWIKSGDEVINLDYLKSIYVEGCDVKAEDNAGTVVLLGYTGESAEKGARFAFDLLQTFLCDASHSYFRIDDLIEARKAVKEGKEDIDTYYIPRHTHHVEDERG